MSSINHSNKPIIHKKSPEKDSNIQAECLEFLDLTLDALESLFHVPLCFNCGALVFS